MVSEERFREMIDGSIKEYYSHYGNTTMARRLLMDSFSHLLVGGVSYKKYSSNQQLVWVNVPGKPPKEVYNSDTDDLTEKKLISILMKSDFKRLKVRKPQWVVRVVDNRMDRSLPEYPFYYFYHDTKEKALESAKVKKEWGYISKIDLMKEVVPNQHVQTGRHDYTLIENIK